MRVAFIARATNAGQITPPRSPALKGVPEITTRDLVYQRRNSFTGRVSAFRVANDSGGLVLPWVQARIVRNGRFLPQRGPRSCARVFIS
jgi:hypothetical protein